MLWSLGKDFNVMLWLAARRSSATFRSRSCISIPARTSARSTNSATASPRNGTSTSSSSDCPPVEEIDPTLPPARALGRAQDAGPQERARALRASRASSPASAATSRRRAPRSACSPRAATTAPGTSATSRRNSGTTSRPTCRRARICASIRCCTGPSSTSGATSRREQHPDRAALFRTQRQALPLARRPGHHLADRQPTPSSIDEIIAELRDDAGRSERAGRAMDHEREDAFERLRAQGICRT